MLPNIAQPRTQVRDLAEREADANRIVGTCSTEIFCIDAAGHKTSLVGRYAIACPR
jgi:hypothetical protein